MFKDNNRSIDDSKVIGFDIESEDEQNALYNQIAGGAQLWDILGNPIDDVDSLIP
jgi:hypothetical protein